MKHRYKLHSDLVSARPARERFGKALETIAEPLSAPDGKAMIAVPQSDNATAQNERTVLLYDQALTPAAMPGAFGLDQWALDTARLVRARNVAKHRGELVPVDGESETAIAKLKYRFEEMAYSVRHGAAREAMQQRAEAVTGVPFGGPDLDDSIVTWADAIKYARTLMRRAEEDRSKGQGAGGKPPPDYEPNDSDIDGTPPPSGGNDGDESESGTGTGQGNPGGGNESPGNGNAATDWTRSESDEIADSRAFNDKRPTQRDRDRFEGIDPWSLGQTPEIREGLAEFGKITNLDNGKPTRLDMRPVKKPGGKRRSQLEGGAIRKAWRAALDGKCFGGRPKRGRSRRGRGTILVDLSASMCWNTESVIAALSALPESTILGYCGHSASGGIAVLADRGKAATPESIAQFKSANGGGNTVDGPALEILARCPGPRVWLSDGGVTGKYDECTASLGQTCHRIQLAGRIFRADSIEEAVAYLNRR